MINLFTPSFADEADTNAQNLSVKEIVARLDPARIHVTLLHEREVDPRIATRPNTRLLTWKRHGNTLRALLRILTKVPDIYFFPREGPLDLAFLRLRRKLALKTAVVSYVVSGGLDQAQYSAHRQLHIRDADAVFANSRYLAKLLNDKMGIAAAGVIYDGVDRRHFYPPEASRDPRERVTVLYAGSFRPYKRASLVIQQAARHPQVRFRLAGAGEEKQNCENLATQLSCNNVKFLGHISSAQLGEEMRRADIFLFPSILEGHPQVLLQAAASGLPCIAMSRYRPEYVIHEETGFIVDNDVDLAFRLDFLIRNAEVRHRMSDAAIVHSRKFEWGAIVRQWQDAFERIVSLRRRSTVLHPVQS